MVDLVKGGRVSLTKDNPGLSKISIGLGWKPNQFDGGSDFDLDATVFLCSNESGSPKCLSEKHIVYYNQLTDADGSVVHSGDNRDGSADMDFSGVSVDEILTVDLSKVSPKVDEISFIVTIYEAGARKQNFGQVSNSVIAIRDESNGSILAKYELDDDFSSETAVQFGSLVKKDGNWAFKAVGAGYNKGLNDFVQIYGL